MRNYILETWEYAVNTSFKLSKIIPYIECFRFDWHLQLSLKRSAKLKIIAFFLNLFKFFNHLRYIIIYQLLRKQKKIPDAKYIFYVADNPSYLRAIVPVAERLIYQKSEVLLFCPANHYKALKRKLAPFLADRLNIIEALNWDRNWVYRCFVILSSVIKSLLDAFRFMFQRVRGNVFLSTDIMNYGLSYYCYSKYWHDYFNQSTKYLLASNELQYWEAAIFFACRNTLSISILLSHGRESEISYPIFANKRFSWSDTDKKLFINDFEAKEKEIEAVGSPYFDELYNSAINRRYSTQINKKEYIKFFAQPYYVTSYISLQQYDKVLAWFYSLTAQINSKKFQIKLHPYDNIQYYNSKPEKISISNENIISSLENCYILITVDSNSVFEASAFGIPSIQCIPQEITAFCDYSTSGLCLKATSEKELYNLCYKLINDPQYYSQIVRKSQNALNNYFSNLGNSLEIIMDKIK